MLVLWEVYGFMNYVLELQQRIFGYVFGYLLRMYSLQTELVCNIATVQIEPVKRIERAPKFTQK